MVDINWMTGGKQGSGIDSALGLFARLMMKFGYNAFGYREYFSNIKGMHSFFTVRVSDKEILSLPSTVDIAVFFDKESVFGEVNKRGEPIQGGHIKDVKSGGTLIVDTSIDRKLIKRNDINILQVDFDRIIGTAATKLKLPSNNVAIAKNIICVAVSAFLMGFNGADIDAAIKSEFAKKPVTVIDMDIAVADETFKYIAESGMKPVMKLEAAGGKDLLYMEGFTASAIGKAIAGCKMQVYYPITPASDESTFIESHTEFGIRTVQPESELAVIAMATGAAHAGIRASTSTSGPGLALMTETITYAGMCEIPVVVVDHQRGAPATGQPTRTEQGDLMFAVHQGHGDFGRIVLAPGSIKEYIEVVANAFNYAERYQLPVIVLGEKAIAQASASMSRKFVQDFKSSYKIDRGKLISNTGEVYKRFEFTDDNISPRIVMGGPGGVEWITGDEHDEYGHIDEDPNNRNRMMEKRNGKAALILSGLGKDEKYSIFGNPKSADLLVVSWGGPCGAIREVVSVKKNIAFLQVKVIEPLDPEIAKIISSAKNSVCVEQNISGQLRQHIASVSGVLIKNQILKYNGRFMRYDELASGLDEVMKGKSKVVLNGY
ncbi:MAG: 2-oxoacid:acceptor oxidoreductase subunit alpha [Candidatus Marsarchaeota archaeon]|nr:2-oxoacid:acceptor oxidoreductase subunit alpha [Candidatus Marsarchaeota archaeon]MCL5112127.1 2-oxoacid:acceptor oxidoreductase subunit alpha [Candidatus Marsarchaeota archaeon]